LRQRATNVGHDFYTFGLKGMKNDELQALRDIVEQHCIERD
jgi:hypothetical protein